jgi:hypothetical protein
VQLARDEAVKGWFKGSGLALALFFSYSVPWLPLTNVSLHGRLTNKRQG